MLLKLLDDHVDINNQSWCLSIAPWEFAVREFEDFSNCWLNLFSVAFDVCGCLIA